jgi:hypothetical protein
VDGIADGTPFAKFEAWLNKYGTPYFCGAAPAACDFHIFEMLDQYEKWYVLHYIYLHVHVHTQTLVQYNKCW